MHRVCLCFHGFTFNRLVWNPEQVLLVVILTAAPCEDSSSMHKGWWRLSLNLHRLREDIPPPTYKSCIGVRWHQRHRERRPVLRTPKKDPKMQYFSRYLILRKFSCPHDHRSGRARCRCRQTWQWQQKLPPFIVSRRPCRWTWHVLTLSSLLCTSAAPSTITVKTMRLIALPTEAAMRRCVQSGQQRATVGRQAVASANQCSARRSIAAAAAAARHSWRHCAYSTSVYRSYRSHCDDIWGKLMRSSVRNITNLGPIINWDIVIGRSA